MKNTLLGLLVVPLVACSSTATNSDASDVSTTNDTVTTDAAFDSNTDDVVSPDDALVDDVLVDDASDAQLADAGSLLGRWRMTALDIMANGTTTHFTDTNAALPGTTVEGRCNGLMTLEQNRIALAYGVLVTDHFLPRADAPTYAAAIGAAGVTAPGTLQGNSFVIPPGTTSVDFTAHADGTISFTDAMSGNVSTYSRADSLPIEASGLISQSLVVRWNPTASMPLAHPRAALAWDNAGGATVTLTNDAPLVFGPNNFAGFALNAVSVPPAASGDIGGTQVAIAYVIAYDDVDQSGAYDPAGGDVLRGMSPAAVAYRSVGTPSSAFAISPLRDLLPGWQFASVHIDYTTNTAGVSPFDPSHLVAADLAVDAGPLSFGIPNLIP